jgi:hypothetical protein
MDVELRDCLHPSLPVVERAARCASRIESTGWYRANLILAGNEDPWEEADRIHLSTITRRMREAGTEEQLSFWVGWLREVAGNDGVRLSLPTPERHLHSV